MGGLDQAVQGLVAADAAIDLAGADRPVAVVGGDVDGAALVFVGVCGLGVKRRQPQRADAHAVKVAVL